MSSRVIPERVLREREIVDLFMTAGVYESTAKDIVKSIPELSGMTEKQADIYKVILREVMHFLRIMIVFHIKFRQRLLIVYLVSTFTDQL
jgi:hypothetical protein